MGRREIGWRVELRQRHKLHGQPCRRAVHNRHAGRAVAELIVHGEFRTLDLSALGYDRIARGVPLRESNVV